MEKMEQAKPAIGGLGMALDQYDDIGDIDEVDLSERSIFRMDYDTALSGRSVSSILREVCAKDDDSVSQPAPLAQLRENHAPAPSSQASSQGSSGSAFLSGIMNAGGQAVAHTPPSAMGTSYEANHFGKRMRSGSLSGRLRSASDLEDRGIIDRSQKGILKDLIISGDDDLQEALDKYESGDPSRLEDMIKSGAFTNRSSGDIDLLDNLDLDFLSVTDDMTIMPPNYGPQKTIPQPMPAAPSFPSRITPPMPVDSGTSTVAYDGIGDLEFTFGGEMGEDQVSLDGRNSRSSSFEVQRQRANSLAYGVLAEPSNDNTTQTIGHWMDRVQMDFPAKRTPDEATLYGFSPGGSRPIPIVADAPKSATQLRKQNARSKSEPKLKTKKQLAEERKREKQEKKEAKRGRKPNGHDQTERKEKKASAKKIAVKQESIEDEDQVMVLPEDEERKETPSGLGLPRSMSDPNLSVRKDEFGLMHVDRPEGWVGAYSPESRKIRVERFLAKRNHRVWTKKVKYDVRKNFADSRLRVKGRFVKKEDEMLMRDLMSLT